MGAQGCLSPVTDPCLGSDAHHSVEHSCVLACAILISRLFCKPANRDTDEAWHVRGTKNSSTHDRIAMGPRPHMNSPTAEPSVPAIGYREGGCSGDRGCLLDGGCPSVFCEYMLSYWLGIRVKIDQ